MKVAIDTNILVYAVSVTGDSIKHVRALSIIDRLGRGHNGIVPIQALIEFSAVVLRKKLAVPDAAHVYVEAFSADFSTIGTSTEDVLSALQAHRDHGLSIWDAMIWSVSHRAGAHLLLSEDFQDGRVLDGVRFVNPFNPINDPLIDAALTP